MPKISFDSDEEFTFEEQEVKLSKAVEPTLSDEDSDDDAAPEAVSISSSRSKAQLEAKAQKEAALSAVKAEKEKRRLRDLQLKQQKQGSKREKKSEQKKLSQQQQQQQQVEKEDSDDSDDDSQEKEREEKGSSQDDKRLPQELLDALKTTEPATGTKRTHLTMADFEQMEAEREAKLERQTKEQRRKQKMAEQGRLVGEYTVKVLNKRPKVSKAGASLQNTQKAKLHRKSVKRQHAVLAGSALRTNQSAIAFRRQ